MHRLIVASQVRARLNLPDDLEVNNSIESAIDATLPALKAVLATGFDHGTKSDLFFVNSSIYRPTNGLYLLKLSNGFVRLDPLPQVFVADTLEAVQLTATPVSGFLSTPERGWLQVSEEYAKKYLRVTYDYGFLAQEGVPDWLSEAAISYVAKILSTQQLTQGKPDLSEIYKFLEGHVAILISSHLRNSSLAIPVLF